MNSIKFSNPPPAEVLKKEAYKRFEEWPPNEGKPYDEAQGAVNYICHVLTNLRRLAQRFSLLSAFPVLPAWRVVNLHRMYNAKEWRKPTLLADVEIQQFNLLAKRLQDESEKLDADQSSGRMARLNFNKLEVNT